MTSADRDEPACRVRPTVVALTVIAVLAVVFAAVIGAAYARIALDRKADHDVNTAVYHEQVAMAAQLCHGSDSPPPDREYSRYAYAYSRTCDKGELASIDVAAATASKLGFTVTRQQSVVLSDGPQWHVEAKKGDMGVVIMGRDGTTMFSLSPRPAHPARN